MEGRVECEQKCHFYGCSDQVKIWVKFDFKVYKSLCHYDTNLIVSPTSNCILQCSSGGDSELYNSCSSMDVTQSFGYTVVFPMAMYYVITFNWATLLVSVGCQFHQPLSIRELLDLLPSHGSIVSMIILPFLFSRAKRKMLMSACISQQNE